MLVTINDFNNFYLFHHQPTSCLFLFFLIQNPSFDPQNLSIIFLGTSSFFQTSHPTTFYLLSELHTQPFFSFFPKSHIFPPNLTSSLQTSHLPSKPHIFPPNLTSSLQTSHLPSKPHIFPPNLTSSLQTSHLPSKPHIFPPNLTSSLQTSHLPSKPHIQPFSSFLLLTSHPMQLGSMVCTLHWQAPVSLSHVIMPLSSQSHPAVVVALMW